MNESSRLAGRLAVVTGASSGIGRAVSVKLAEAGVAVCLVGRDRGRLKGVAENVTQLGAEAFVHRCDVADDGERIRLAEAIGRAHTGLDILVHSAGAFSRGPVESAPLSDFDFQFAVNTRAPYHLSQLFLPLLRSRQGQIVFVNSTAGLRSHSGVSQYAASKFALKAVADALREEVNDAGVRVTSVYPGRTATPMQEEVRRLEGREYLPELLLQPEDVAELVIHLLALPPTAEVTDVTIRQMRKG